MQNAQTEIRLTASSQFNGHPRPPNHQNPHPTHQSLQHHQCHRLHTAIQATSLPYPTQPQHTHQQTPTRNHLAISQRQRNPDLSADPIIHRCRCSTIQQHPRSCWSRRSRSCRPDDDIDAIERLAAGSKDGGGGSSSSSDGGES